MIYANNIYVAAATTFLSISTDAITWTLRSAPSFSGLGSAAYGNNIYLAGGSGVLLAAETTTASAAGNGGNGTRGGGGGGGGYSAETNRFGLGGNGGDGYVRITWW